MNLKFEPINKFTIKGFVYRIFTYKDKHIIRISIREGRDQLSYIDMAVSKEQLSGIRYGQHVVAEGYINGFFISNPINPSKKRYGQYLYPTSISPSVPELNTVFGLNSGVFYGEQFSRVYIRGLVTYVDNTNDNISIITLKTNGNQQNKRASFVRLVYPLFYKSVAKDDICKGDVLDIVASIHSKEGKSPIVFPSGKGLPRYFLTLTVEDIGFEEKAPCTEEEQNKSVSSVSSSSYYSNSSSILITPDGNKVTDNLLPLENDIFIEDDTTEEKLDVTILPDYFDYKMFEGGFKF